MSITLNNVIELIINDDKDKRYIKIDKSRKTFTDRELNVTIIEINQEEDGIKDFLDVDEDYDSEQYKEINI